MAKGLCGSNWIVPVSELPAGARDSRDRDDGRRRRCGQRHAADEGRADAGQSCRRLRLERSLYRRPRRLCSREFPLGQRGWLCRRAIADGFNRNIRPRWPLGTNIWWSSGWLQLCFAVAVACRRGGRFLLPQSPLRDAAIIIRRRGPIQRHGHGRVFRNRSGSCRLRGEQLALLRHRRFRLRSRTHDPQPDRRDADRGYRNA